MARVRVRHHSKGYAELIKDPAIVADLQRRAERIAAAAGGESAGYIAEPSTPTRKRARAAVIALRGDPDNSMIRNLGSGR